MTVQDRPTTDQDRSDSVQDRSEFVPVAEAARRLGISAATVKRRIAAGALEAEQLARPQGVEYRVRLPREEPAPLTERTTSEGAPSTGTAQDVSAAIRAATAPLVERLAVQDATIAEQARTIERQAEQVADLRETIGRQGAELEAERDTARSEREATELLRRRNTRRLLLALAALAGLLLAAGTVVAAGWPP
ncbi:MAG: hypothetical protein M3O34_20865 [Chloroflexota bacterium]|nr:hypothetical protein [Chloroflexota bacterium]